MRQQNIAIIGSTDAGKNFLCAMNDLKNKGVNVLGFCGELNSKAGIFAEKAGIRCLDMDDLIRLGEKLDIIFDLSGDAKILSELRRTLFQSNNRHTVIAPQSVAQLMCKMLDCDVQPPFSQNVVGY